MIEIDHLVKTYPARHGLLEQPPVKALRQVSLTLPSGSAFSIIGESGCGKTTLGRIVAGLESYDSGHLQIDGTDIGTLRTRDRARFFLQVQVIPQDPYAALNPARTIGQSLLAPLLAHARRTRRTAAWATDRADELLRQVDLNPGEVLDKYPHALSGGQRQRVVIARALTVDPAVVIADEAISMIDVSLRLGV
ncbi:MAG: dipeptide/oligopeptide/nickel ABC transporter ATP-binding protein, partial [Firmicutes bacterium]|nr:dipeptide/oligopeptide/nickel ABC transporter ATP-binding protein [Bacillota bacterium]